MALFRTGMAWGQYGVSGAAAPNGFSVPAQLPPWPGGTVPPVPQTPPAAPPFPGVAPHGPQFVEPPTPAPGPNFINTGRAPRVTPLGLGILAALGVLALGVAMRRREGAACP